MNLETIAHDCAAKIVLELVGEGSGGSRMIGDVIADIQKEVLQAMYRVPQGPVYRLGHNKLPVKPLVMKAYPQLTSLCNIRAYQVSETSWQVRIDNQVDPRYVGLDVDAAMEIQEQLYTESWDSI